VVTVVVSLLGRPEPVPGAAPAAVPLPSTPGGA
jgi:hypothetical protein